MRIHPGSTSWIPTNPTRIDSLSACLLRNLRYRWEEWRQGPEANVDPDRRRETWLAPKYLLITRVPSSVECETGDAQRTTLVRSVRAASKRVIAERLDWYVVNTAGEDAQTAGAPMGLPLRFDSLDQDEPRPQRVAIPDPLRAFPRMALAGR